MKRILSFLLAAAAFLPGYARADEPVVSLAPATSLIGASTYLQVSGVGNNQLLFNTTLFGVSAGALTINPNSITSSYLSTLLAGPGSCTNCNLSYDASGRLTVATSGSGGGGGGNFTGPAGAVSGDLVSFNGTSGLIGQDSGILQSNVVTASGALTTNSILLGGGSRALGASIGPSAQGLAGWNTGGTPSVIALGSNLSMTGATLNAAGGGGGTPGGATQSIQINSSGAFAGIGPTAQTLAGWNTGGAAATITLGSNLSMTGSTLNATGGGSTAFSALTSGANSTAAMLVGSGSSLGVTGTGAVTATNVPAALGTGSVCSTAGLLSAPVSCPISLVPQAGTSFALVAGNAGSLVVAQSGSIPTVTLAQSTGALGAGFGVDLFTGAPGATLNIITSRINGGISSLKLGAWQDVAIGADGTGQYLGALSVPQPPTQTHTTCLWDDFVWAACTAGGGGSTALNQITSGTTNTLSSITTTFTTEVWLSASTGAKTDNIPACASGINKDYLIENDGQNTAATYPVTITPASGTIGPNATASYTLASNGNSAVFQCDSTSTTWRLVASSVPGTAVRYASGTSLTVGANDNGNEISQSNASPVAATIAQAGTAGFPLGAFQTIIHNTGAGLLTLTPTPPSTINGGLNINISQDHSALVFADAVGNYEAVRMGDRVPLQTGSALTLATNSGYAICTTTCTITVPVPAAGNQFCVLNGDNVSTVITLSALGGSAQYENTARTSFGTAGTGTLVSGGAVGDMICIVGQDTTHFLSATFKGTWTAS